MNPKSPVYTEKTECQDCYKCVRECPVKAIRIEKGHAAVIDDLCVQCGHCVEVCPVGAKRVRRDIGRVKQLLAARERVMVSLAPSFVAEFEDCAPGQLVAALKRLGFWGVSETALGAEEVSANMAARLESGERGLFLSSACPTVVQLIKRFHPEFADNVTQVMSPVMAHCRMLRARYGDDVGIVFIGPCIAKKTEAHWRPDLLNEALTFEEVREWFKDEGIRPETLKPGEDDDFIPERAAEGALYPIDGGMIEGIRRRCGVTEAGFMAFSGVENIQRAINDLRDPPEGRSLFLELLACEGGCVNGPRVARRDGTARKRLSVINTALQRDGAKRTREPVDVANDFAIKPIDPREHNENEVLNVLRSIGKLHPRDELNCGGCGYDSCRDFACALLDGKAERTMCVSYMRKLAHKKANTLIKAMPSGVVIVDENLKIIECNRRFADLIGEETLMVYDAAPGLEGAALAKIIPFSRLFRGVIETGAEKIEKDVRLEKTILHVMVFTIEKYHVVGGIIQDITVPAVQKNRVVKKAREVMRKQLSTVQKIAYLLGENAAESEVILNSIIDSYDPDKAGGDEE